MNGRFCAAGLESGPKILTEVREPVPTLIAPRCSLVGKTSETHPTRGLHTVNAHRRTVAGPIIDGKRSSCMKQRKQGVAVWRLDEIRYAMGVDQVIRYVGSQEECERRAEILLPKNARDIQDRALARACRMGGSISV